MNEGIEIMKTMTIHGIDQQLAELIKSKAESERLSINKTIKTLLETSLGVKPRPERTNIDDFKEFCGVWTQTDVEEFEKKIEELSQIDTREWP
jgi:hypothetical protein